MGLELFFWDHVRHPPPLHHAACCNSDRGQPQLYDVPSDQRSIQWPLLPASCHLPPGSVSIDSGQGVLPGPQACGPTQETALDFSSTDLCVPVVTILFWITWILFCSPLNTLFSTLVTNMDLVMRLIKWYWLLSQIGTTSNHSSKWSASLIQLSVLGKTVCNEKRAWCSKGLASRRTALKKPVTYSQCVVPTCTLNHT